MTPRLLLTALLLTAATLAGCDALGGASDDVTGTWTGEAAFTTDTLLTTPAAVNIQYDLVERFELRLIHDEGLVRGTITRTGGGSKVFRSATGVVDSTDIAEREPVSHAVYGTYREDADLLALEVLPRWRDHPVCGTEIVPYSNGLLTFELTSRKGRSQAYILLEDGGIGSDGEPFSLAVRSEDRFTIDRGGRDEPELAAVISDPGEVYAECGTGGGTLAPAPDDAPDVAVTD